MRWERGGVSGREEGGTVLEVEVEESYFHVFLVVGIAGIVFRLCDLV